MSTSDERRRVSEVAMMVDTLTDKDHLVPAVLLSEALRGKPIVPVDEPPIEELTGAQALALAVAMFNAEVVQPNDDQTAEDMADDVLNAVCWVYPTEQLAACAAVQDLASAYDMDIPAWVEQALADDTWTACEHIMDTVEQACRDTGPGRRWVQVLGVGVVLFESP